MQLAAQAVLEGELLAQHAEVAQHQVRRMHGHRVAHRGDRARQQHVVGIQEPQVIATRIRHQRVACRRQAAVAVVAEQADDIAMRLAQVARDGGAVVGRGVVEKHDLHAAVDLREHRLHAFAQVGLDAIERHEHAQPGMRGRHVGCGRRRWWTRRSLHSETLGFG